jgi:hypothetical protein
MTSETIISNRCGHTATIPLLAAFIFIICACGEGEVPPSGESETGAVVATTDPEELLVEIAFDEYIIFMNAVVPSGPVPLRLANRGFEEHNLLFVVVESDSTVWEIERRVSPGERRTVTLDLKPGMYRAVCDFADHEERGMSTNFEVRETTPSDGGSER